ncbi:hypothetical protein TU79_18155, partial [Pseudomonas trivialis]
NSRIAKRPVASGLAPRGAAQQPQNQAQGVPDTAHSSLLGLLRSPTRGKPARHNALFARI